MLENNVPVAKVTTKTFTCPNCGGELRHNIKKDKILCSACGHEEELYPISDNIKEYDFNAYAQHESESVPFIGMSVAECQSCGSTITFDKHETATTCPMCGSAQIFLSSQKTGIPPEGIIPFKVDKQDAEKNFRTWINSLWFAPNNLKTSLHTDNLIGKFIPFWTYDVDVTATYFGSGGENKTVKDADGKTHTETDWKPVSGRVSRSFNDLLVCSSNSQGAQDAAHVAPFDTVGNARPYSPEYLSGYQAEVYAIKADVCFEAAKSQIVATLVGIAENEIRMRYDAVKGVQVNPQYNKVFYKHMLLPVWSFLFAYNGKTYRCMVNGETGKVYGQRPYSSLKIILAILLTLAVVVGVIYLYNQNA